MFMIFGDIRSFRSIPKHGRYFPACYTVDQSSSNPPNNTTNLVTDILKLGATPVKTKGEAWMEDVRAEGVTEAIPPLPIVPVGNELDLAGRG